MAWTTERSGDGKWIILTGSEYWEEVLIQNDDVPEDQMPLAEKIAGLLNGSVGPAI